MSINIYVKVFYNQECTNY